MSGFGSELLPQDFQELKPMLYKVIKDQGLQLMPGVEKLLVHLYENGVTMAIATNVTKPQFEMTLEFAPRFIKDHFSHWVCGGDDPEVKANKPDPQVYWVCANRFSPPPKSFESCVIFEDSIRGITGAVNSGMKSVLINRTKAGLSEEITNEITVCVDSLESFKPESIGLPPY